MHAMGATMSAGSTAAGIVHTSGVSRCASAWACPVCAAKLSEVRAGEIDTGLARHLETEFHGRHGLAYFVTATAHHQAGMHLSATLDLVQESYRAVMQSSTAKRSLTRRRFRPGPNGTRVVDREWQVYGGARRAGYVGQIRAVEITHGRNGWHPHIHTVFLFRAGTRPAVAERWLHRLGVHWSKQLVKRGSHCNDRGWDVRPIRTNADIGGYLTKIDGGWGPGLELAGANRKTSAGKTPFALLDEAAGGSAWAEMMFKIYEAATFGRRTIVWSRGLKARLGIVDQDDDEAIDEAPVDELVVEAVVPAGAWKQLLRTGQAAELLGALAGIATQKGHPHELWRWPDKWLFVSAVRTSSTVPPAQQPSAR